MSKPKTAYFPKDSKFSGIDITYVKSKNTVRIGGWYDSFVGIQSTEVTLKEFLDLLGITEKDCFKALNKQSV